jgi:D-tyrosyl-tRNA(Tyr) deacylase
MRALIQRVKSAKVEVANNTIGQINQGLLVFLGIEETDTKEEIEYLVKKIAQMRIFSDREGKMNLSAIDLKLEFLVISQFTLFAQTQKGNRPSFTSAAPPLLAIPLYQDFVSKLGDFSGLRVATGEFGADMQVYLQNDGPVTIWLDTKNK